MIRLLRDFLRKAPLLCGILLVWLILTLLSFVGRGRAYKNYSTEHGKLPGLSLVMRGLHDHVLPWSKEAGGRPSALASSGGAKARAGSGDDGGKAAPDASGGDGGSASGTPDGAASGSDPDKNASEGRNAGSSAEPANGSGNTGKAGKSGEGVEDGKDPQKSGADGKNAEGAGADGKNAEGAGADGKNAENAGADGKKNGSAGADENNSEGVEKDGGNTQRRQGGDSPRVPASSSTPVVPAKDYGVAETRYLASDDAVFNTDTEGLFAANGIFFPLQEVDDSYFKDALFIGDSRTVGLYEYGGMSGITSFLARESTTVYDLFDENEMMTYSPRGMAPFQRTLVDLLSKAKFRKIYLSVGVNELGIPDTNDYYKEFRRVVTKIHKLQPDAIIYIQGIMHVSSWMSSTDRVFNNRAIVQRNSAIATLANGRSIFYIDMNGDLCDENGDLRPELSGDGIHLKASACSLWHEFLRKNAAVVPDEG